MYSHESMRRSRRVLLLLILTLGLSGSTGLTAQVLQGPEVVLFDTKGYQLRGLDKAIAASGDFVVAWVKEERDGTWTNVFARAFSANGKPKTSEIRVAAADVGRQMDPAVAMSANGDFVVVWQSQAAENAPTRVWGQRFTANGKPAGRRFAPGLWWNLAQTQPDVARAPDGRFVVVWSESDRSVGYGGDPTNDVFIARFSRDGKPIGREFTLPYSLLDQSNPAVAIDSAGRFVVAYEWYGSSRAADDYERSIEGAAFDFEGRVLGHLWAGLPWSGLQDEAYPAVAMTEDGTCMLAWADPRANWFHSDDDWEWPGVGAEAFALNGSSLGQGFRVNDASRGPSAPAIAATPNGEFLVSYNGYIRRFRADGTPQTGEIDLDRGSIVMAPSGRGIMVWVKGDKVMGQRVYIQPQ